MFTHLVDILSVANAPNMNLFSVHYPGENFPVSEWDVTPDRMTNKKTNRHYESVFEALATERSNKSTAQLKQGPAIPVRYSSQPSPDNLKLNHCSRSKKYSHLRRAVWG